MAGKSSRLGSKSIGRPRPKAAKPDGPEVSTGNAKADAITRKAVRSTDIAQRARRHTDAALEAFVSVMQDASAPAAARVAAATQILNWAHGKGAGIDGEEAPKTVRLAWEG